MVVLELELELELGPRRGLARGLELRAGLRRLMVLRRGLDKELRLGFVRVFGAGAKVGATNSGRRHIRLNQP